VPGTASDAEAGRLRKGLEHDVLFEDELERMMKGSIKDTRLLEGRAKNMPAICSR
jgi:hypothetical protein